jgi:hypothetical protein
MTICTIITKNRLAHARVLCRSFLQQHPDGHCYALVVDPDPACFDPRLEPFTMISLDDMSLPQPHDRFCFQYTALELAAALKPTLVRHLFEKRGERLVLYLDADILVTAPLTPLATRVQNGGGILVTPHLDRDYPDDGKMPNDAWILLHGVFNLGFFGVRNCDAGNALLRWFENKTRDKCIYAPTRGYFVDQRFFDLAVTLHPDIEIERSVGCNVGYWNLHSRKLSCTAHGQWLCNGEPLVFFHFSNYQPEQPDRISGYQNRYLLKDRPDLQPMFYGYRDQLLANGYAETWKWPYKLNYFASGQPITARVRRIYRANPTKFPYPFHSRTLAWRSRCIGLAAKMVDGLGLLLAACRIQQRAGKLLQRLATAGQA